MRSGVDAVEAFCSLGFEGALARRFFLSGPDIKA